MLQRAGGARRRQGGQASELLESRYRAVTVRGGARNADQEACRGSLPLPLPLPLPIPLPLPLPQTAVIDRCNLTVLEEPGQEGLVDFLVENQVQSTSI